ncbi:MAG TPA: hypothetical protein VFA50_07920 [Stellaceae bacterium]|nr:hypothetical protein [Stellaceae bacterium]
MSIEENDLEEQSGGRFPFITLEKAIDRSRQLHINAGKHQVPVGELHNLWGYSASASGWKQTLAALKYYGLVETSGVKDSRSVRLTEEARRYFLDERPEKHAEAHRVFALKPKSLAKLWQLWGHEPPGDPIARSTLKVQFGYAEKAASEILAIYKANILFAGLSKHDAKSAQPSDRADESVELRSTPEPAATPEMRATELEPERRASTHTAPPLHSGKVRLMEGERVVFTEEGQPNQYLKLIASGEFDDTLLEALEDFVKRQRKRLTRSAEHKDPLN